MTEEKPSSESTEAQKDEAMQADTVTSTEAGATNETATTVEKTNGSVEEKNEDEAKKKVKARG